MWRTKTNNKYLLKYLLKGNIPLSLSFILLLFTIPLAMFKSWEAQHNIFSSLKKFS